MGLKAHGGGRKTNVAKDATLLSDLGALVEPTSRCGGAANTGEIPSRVVLWESGPLTPRGAIDQFSRTGRSPECERKRRGCRAISAGLIHETRTGRIKPMRKIALAAAMVGLIVMPALAQAPPAGTPTRIRGTVDKLDGKNLIVKSRDGQMLTIALADNVAVITLVKKTVADIKAGDYVASTGIKGTDGKLHAIEVRIFPEASRGVGDGQHPWDLKPDSIMTNATVGKVDQAPQGPVLHVTFKGGESEYTIGPDVPVLANGPGDISLLKPGVAVFVIAMKSADGKLTSARMYAEKDGIKPPM
jgi:hypothetical protein